MNGPGRGLCILRGYFVSGDWPRSRLPKRPRLCLPTAHLCLLLCSPLPPNSQHPTAGQGIVSLFSLPQAATALWESQCCSQSRLSIDFPSPAHPHQNSTGFDVTLLRPATQHHFMEPGLSPGQSSLALTGSFPNGPGQVGSLQSLHLPPPHWQWLRCPTVGQWLGNVLKERDFGSDTSVSQAEGPTE